MENTNETNNIPVDQKTRKPSELFNSDLSNEEETPSGIRGGGTSTTTFNKKAKSEINSAGDVASLNTDENFQMIRSLLVSRTIRPSLIATNTKTRILDNSN